MTEGAGEEEVMDLVARLMARDEAGLSPLGAALVAALHLGIAGDSRSFARIFGMEHALILREAVALSEEAGLLEVTRRDERTGRLFLRPTPTGQALLEGVGAG